MIELPIHLPGNPFSDQLTWVADWAGVDPAPLLAMENEIAAVLNKGACVCTQVLKECLPKTPEIAERYYDKLSSRRMALYRLEQMNETKHFRPFWQLKGKCAGKGSEQKTLLANDPFWGSSTVPWNCTAENCDCRVVSLSRIELKRYIEVGCRTGDEAAAELWPDFNQKERND